MPHTVEARETSGEYAGGETSGKGFFARTLRMEILVLPYARVESYE